MVRDTTEPKNEHIYDDFIAVRTSLFEDASNHSNPMAVQTLSLYITSLMMEYPQADEISASMMVAIKCQDDCVGERGARAEWVWEMWQNDWVYRQEREFWGKMIFSYSDLVHLLTFEYRMHTTLVITFARKPKDRRNGLFRHLYPDT